MPGCTQARATLPAKDGGIKILGFMVWAISKIDFSVFVPRNFCFSVLVSVTVSNFCSISHPVSGFSIQCGLVFFRFLFGKFAPQQPQPRAHLPCLQSSGLTELYFGFAVFDYSLYGFAVTNSGAPSAPRGHMDESLIQVSVTGPETLITWVIIEKKLEIVYTTANKVTYRELI